MSEQVLVNPKSWVLSLNNLYVSTMIKGRVAAMLYRKGAPALVILYMFLSVALQKSPGITVFTAYCI